MTTQIASILFVIVSCLSCHGRINTAPSVDWLVDQSNAVGVYSVTSLKIVSPPEAHDDNKKQWGRWGEAMLNLKLTEKVKGEPSSDLESVYSIHPIDLNGEILKEITQGHQMLCFFKSAGSDGLRLSYIVNLSSPAQHGPHTAFSFEFRIMPDRASILTAVNQRMKSLGPPDADPNEHRIEVPSGTPAFSSLFGGSICYLIVPRDLWPKHKP